MANVILQSARLGLWPIDDSDEVFLHSCFTDPYVRQYLWDDEIIPLSLTQQIIQQNTSQFTQENCGLWKLVLPESKEEIGLAGLWYFFEEAQPQLIYALFEHFGGQGYATEASQQIIRYAFEQLDFAYLDAACDAPHMASQKVALRLGMKERMRREEDGKQTVFFRLRRIND